MLTISRTRSFGYYPSVRNDNQNLYSKAVSLSTLIQKFINSLMRAVESDINGICKEFSKFEIGPIATAVVTGRKGYWEQDLVYIYLSLSLSNEMGGAGGGKVWVYKLSIRLTILSLRSMVFP